MASTSSSVRTRASAEVWLIGKPTESLSSARLPTNGDVLRRFHYHHLEEKQSVKKSVKTTTELVLHIWERARIPTQNQDKVEIKINKLLKRYNLLKKSRKRDLESCRMNEELFKSDLLEIFDIATSNALETMTNEEDKTFLIMQREDTLSCSMAGVDKVLDEKETRKRKREAEIEKRRLKAKSQQEINANINVDSIGSSPCSVKSSTSEEFHLSSASTPTEKIKPQKKSLLLNADVVTTMDRVNLSGRNAMFVIGSVAKALGTQAEDISLSHSTIHRMRKKVREVVVESDKASFSPQNPLVLHWDSKLLPSITGGVEKVDRVAVLVTGGGTEKLLAVPKIKRGTGQEQADACLKVLDEWDLKKDVQGLCFDTTASNTGLNMGACTLIENSLKKDLIWIACRHHVFEVILSDVFKSLFGSSGGPDVNLFKRFQKKWPEIDQERFVVGNDDLFQAAELQTLRQEMKSYYSHAIETQQPRADYLELLSLCHIFLGKPEPAADVKFRAPGALHQARWMAKAIYCLKIYMFQDQFTLTASEKRSVTDLSLFVSLVYGRYWNEAPLAERAPLNDANLFKLLEKYPNKSVSNTACQALRRHLWYFSEHLIGLSLFDSRVTIETKREMVQNIMHKPPKSKALKRLDGKTFDPHSSLQSFITQRTAILFDLLIKNGQEKSSIFLAKDPAEWPMDEVYVEMKEKARQMKVVNDCAERGIALISTFNSSITKDEQQKQYLLRVVDLHRKKIPVASKSGIFSTHKDNKDAN